MISHNGIWQARFGCLFLALVALATVAAPARAQDDVSILLVLPRAAANNDFRAVVTLLSRGQSVDTEGEDRRTALSFAASNGNLQIADFLLQHGANVDHRDRFGETALHWAALNGHVAMVRRLIQAKATIDEQNQNGTTPLMLAIGANRIGVVRALIKGGADPTVNDYTGHNAFDWARGKPQILAILKQARKKP